MRALNLAASRTPTIVELPTIYAQVGTVDHVDYGAVWEASRAAFSDAGRVVGTVSVTDQPSLFDETSLYHLHFSNVGVARYGRMPSPYPFCDAPVNMQMMRRTDEAEAS